MSAAVPVDAGHVLPHLPSPLRPTKPLKAWLECMCVYVYLCAAAVESPLTAAKCHHLSIQHPTAPSPPLSTNTPQVPEDPGHMWFWPCVHLTMNYHAP